MHPHTFLTTYWRLDLRPQVFVAMPFGPPYDQRFEDIVVPAVEQLEVGGNRMRAHRVDLSRSGDSILTEIADGVAHSQLVLADVSTVGHDSKTGRPYRNANVMYEVGLALACRRPEEVLLVHDDRDRLLFDVSTVPHVQVDFADQDCAIQTIGGKLRERIGEQNYVNDARVELSIARLTTDEAALLRIHADDPESLVWSLKSGSPTAWLTIPRLVDKGLIRVVGEFEEQQRPAYQLTPLGRTVSHLVKHSLRRFRGTAAEGGPEASGLGSEKKTGEPDM